MWISLYLSSEPLSLKDPRRGIMANFKLINETQHLQSKLIKHASGLKCILQVQQPLEDNFPYFTKILHTFILYAKEDESL